VHEDVHDDRRVRDDARRISTGGVRGLHDRVVLRPLLRPQERDELPGPAQVRGRSGADDRPLREFLSAARATTDVSRHGGVAREAREEREPARVVRFLSFVWFFGMRSGPVIVAMGPDSSFFDSHRIPIVSHMSRMMTDVTPVMSVITAVLTDTTRIMKDMSAMMMIISGVMTDMTAVMWNKSAMVTDISALTIVTR
jgi:hypothetical protein